MSGARRRASRPRTNSTPSRSPACRPRDDRRGILNPTAAVAALSAWIPGRMSKSLKTQGVVRYAGQDIGISIFGVEPRQEARVSSIAQDFRQGSFDPLIAGGNNIVVGDSLAKRLGADLGTTVTLVSATGQSRAVKIVGLFHTGVTARDEGEGYVLLKIAQILSERPNAINEIRLKLDDPAAAPAVAKRAEALIGYKAVAWQEANESLLEAFVIRNIIMYTVVGAILLVAGFGIFNIVSTITHEKARDIAILKSLGFEARDMRRLFLLEGLTLGLAGSLAGWLLGFALCFGLSQVELHISGGTVGREITKLPLTWSPWHYLIAAGFALAAAGIAGYLPARQAAKLNPVDIIRGRHERAHRGQGLTRVLPETVPVTLVKDVSLAIGERELVAVTGPSGSGKSSLLYLLGLLDRQTGGDLQHRREGCIGAGRAGPRPAAAGIDRLRLPVPLPAAGVHGAGECRDPDAQARPPRRPGDARAGGCAARRARPRRPSRQAAGPAVRRPAPARGGGPVAGQRPAAAAGRRADRQPRLPQLGAGLRHPLGAGARARQDGGGGDPRCRSGGADGPADPSGRRGGDQR